MSESSYVTANGEPVREMRYREPQIGPWHADLVFTGSPDLSGTVTLDINGVTKVGTIVSTHDGVFVGTKGCRIIGGYNGWSRTLSPKHYHSDGQGVRALLIAQDAARDAGEQLGAFVPTQERIGIDYVRSSDVPAAKTLEDCTQGNQWWIDAQGFTVVGVRPTATLSDDQYQVMAFDPKEHRATLAIDGLSALKIGSVLTQNLATPQTVRELEIVFSETEPLRAQVWTGGDQESSSRLATLLRGIARRSTDRKLGGVYHYRVTSLVGERIEASPVNSPLPTVRPISMWPGVPGTYGELVIGSDILIQFINEDPSRPVITGFGPSSSAGFAAVRLAIGGTSGPAAAREGDAVESGGPGTTVTFTPVTPAPGPMTPGTPYLISFDATAPSPVVAAKLTGEITSGSDKVEIA